MCTKYLLEMVSIRCKCSKIDLNLLSSTSFNKFTHLLDNSHTRVKYITQL